MSSHAVGVSGGQMFASTGVTEKHVSRRRPAVSGCVFGR